jgi:hypothetical protein
MVNRLQARGGRLGRIDFEFGAVDGSVVEPIKRLGELEGRARGNG